MQCDWAGRWRRAEWECLPAQRVDFAADATRRELLDCPLSLAATGVLPTDAALEVVARALRAQVPAPAAGVEASVAHTDCSVFDGADPLLARAGWAASLVDA